MAKKVKKAAPKTKKKVQGKVIHWIHADEEIIILGGSLAVIMMIIIFLV